VDHKEDVLKKIWEAMGALSSVDARVNSAKHVNETMDQAYEALSAAEKLIQWSEPNKP